MKTIQLNTAMAFKLGHVKSESIKITASHVTLQGK